MPSAKAGANLDEINAVLRANALAFALEAASLRNVWRRAWPHDPNGWRYAKNKRRSA